MKSVTAQVIIPIGSLIHKFYIAIIFPRFIVYFIYIINIIYNLCMHKLYKFYFLFTFGVSNQKSVRSYDEFAREMVAH
jgi:hypothetical protein